MANEYREYKVFIDEVGKSFVIWVDMVKICLFVGSVGRLKEIESGYIKRDKNQLGKLLGIQKDWSKNVTQ